MFLDVPAGIESMCRSGASPIQPAEVVTRLREVALNLQRRHTDLRQPVE